ncbi:MAG TPA: nitrile hydratase accessory protein [Gemmatimonadales bacterium]|nr:nitrile hydratase accessory protein [Gemmatimonadales bacterium]
MIDREVADSLPRKNGDLVFAAPWESRAFGMAVLMNEKGAYQWEEFRDSLIEQVGRVGQEGIPPSEHPTQFYEQWLSAFESLLLVRGVIEPEELAARVKEYQELRRDPVF